jgi:hypothetical protein
MLGVLNCQAAMARKVAVLQKPCQDRSPLLEGVRLGSYGIVKLTEQ